jgi:hypothetical protein
MMPFMILRDPYQPKDYGLLYATRRVGNPGIVPSSIGIITLEQTDRYEKRDAAIRANHRLPKRLRKALPKLG